MSDDDKLYDKDGNAYQKNWAGQPEQQWDTWRQQPARDNAELENQPSEYAPDGTPLYRQRESSSSSSSSGSSAGGEIILVLLLLVIVLGLVLGPLLFGGWLLYKGWKSQSDNLKWLWVASCFVWAVILGAMFNNLLCFLPYLAVGAGGVYLVQSGKSPQEALSSLFQDIVEWLKGVLNAVKAKLRTAKAKILVAATFMKEEFFRVRYRALIQSKMDDSQYRCEACGFSFQETYSSLGKNYIVAHFVESSFGLSNATLENVALLCANCHAMVHIQNPPLSLEGLRQLIKEHQTQAKSI
jgi:hypothetical protein